MDARMMRLAVAAGALWSVGTCVQAAGFRTTNFTVSAQTPQLAREIGLTAERYRKELAIEWLGKEMPAWSRRCPITARVDSHLGAGGATSFLFEKGEVYGWQMSIQGSRERILDSVLPHEVTHTIFASHFRQPLPRWADEGACTTVEHRSEKAKQQHLLIRFLKTKQGIPFSHLFAMKEYPANVMPLYSQGYSLARYLIQQGGRRKFIDFLSDGLQDENWPRAIREQYGYDNLWALQNTWLDWVRQGSPLVTPSKGPSLKGPSDGSLVAQTDSTARDASGVIYRAQSADPSSPKPSPLKVIAAAEKGSKLVPVQSKVAKSVYAKSRTMKNVASRGPAPSDTAGSGTAGQVIDPLRRASSGTRASPFGTAGQVIDPSRRASRGTHVTSNGTHAPPREVLLEWHREATGAVYDASGPRRTMLR